LRTFTRDPPAPRAEIRATSHDRDGGWVPGPRRGTEDPLNTIPAGGPGAPGLRALLLSPPPGAAEVWLESARAPQRHVTRHDLRVLVAAWTAAGTGPAGRRVGLLAPDPVDLAVLFVVLVATGVVVVPLDPRAPAAASAELVARSGAEAVLVAGSVDHALARLGVPVVETGAELLPPATLLGTDGGSDGGSGGSGGVLLFSSGSTGPRKPVLLTEANLLHVARAVAGHHRLAPDDRGYNPLPLFHVNGEVVAVLGSLVSGGALVLDDRFHRTGFEQLVADRGVTWINAVPAVLSILAGSPDAQRLPDRVRFVRSASAPLPVPVLERFEERYGVRVLETYGMTEAASQITANPLDGERRPGSVGLPVGVELRVDGDRVRIRGEGVVRSYPDGAGAERFDPDGWLDTGDLGRLDADGYLYLVGREGDAINRGGEKVFPRAVEEVLRRHPRVRDAVVVGADDDVLGQVPVAHVVPDPPTDADDPAAARRLVRELRDLGEQGLDRSQRPTDVRVVGALPTGPTGKVSRTAVAAGSTTPDPDAG